MDLVTQYGLNEIKREFGYPVLNDGEITAVRDGEKTETSDNIMKEGKKGIEHYGE